MAIPRTHEIEYEEATVTAAGVDGEKTKINNVLTVDVNEYNLLLPLSSYYYHSAYSCMKHFFHKRTLLYTIFFYNLLQIHGIFF